MASDDPTGFLVIPSRSHQAEAAPRQVAQDTDFLNRRFGDEGPGQRADRLKAPVCSIGESSTGAWWV